METLNQALRGVQENLAALAMYLVITVGVFAINTAVDLAVHFPADTPFGSPALVLYHLGWLAVLIVAYSLAESAAFARIGKHMDRPLFRIESDREAIQRYFVMWLIINTAVFLPGEVALWTQTVQDNERAAAMFLPLNILLSVANIPIGAALMFGGGKVRWQEIGDRLAPLWRQLPKTLVLFLFGGMAFLCINIMAMGERAQSQHVLRLLVQIVGGYCDCLMFAAAWYICMFDRSNPEDDFEF